MRPRRSKHSQRCENSPRDRQANSASDTAINSNTMSLRSQRGRHRQDYYVTNETENAEHPRGEGRRGGGRRQGKGQGRGQGRGHPHGLDGRGFGRGRGKRPLRHGDLRYLILSLIEKTPRHGYEMITMISERTKGGYNPSPGVIYPALDLLQDLGWATVSEEGDKKLYSLTSDGKAALAENTERVSAINERLARFAGETGGNSAHTVKTAFQRLRHEIRGSLSSETTDEVKREKIINLINQAREDIAKLG